MIANPDGAVVDQGTDRNARTREPVQLAQAVARVLQRLPGDSPARPVLDAMLAGHRTNQHRRASVLAHEDLRKRLTQAPLSFRRAEDWNGYVPPYMLAEDDGELLRLVTATRGGEMVVRLNQRGNRSAGTLVNDSPRRAALIDISAEAWKRDNATPSA